MKGYIIGLVIATMMLAGCAQQTETPPSPPAITSFEECVAAGNPVMESYPRQCNADGQNFVEETGQEAEMTLEEAKAMAQDTECTEKGALGGEGTFNQNSRTWWIDLEMKPEFENEMCNPACVVSEETRTAEINWRCTGLITE